MIKLFVKYYNFNADRIEEYDVLRYQENLIKRLKKKCANKEEFFQNLIGEFRYEFWKKSEWELIISKTEEERIVLSPWIGRRNTETVSLDVTDDKNFDWIGFSDKHIDNQCFGNQAKIDVYDQIMYGDRFSNIVDELWYTRLSYERDNPKFHKN